MALSGLTQVNGGLRGRKADLEAKSAFTQSSLLKAAGLKRTVLYMAILSYFRSIVYYLECQVRAGIEICQSA